jgi:AraC-like DNA-binding protein
LAIANLSAVKKKYDLTGNMKSDLDRFPPEEWLALGLKAKFKTKTLARLCGRSPRQLQRYFLSVFKRSPKHWLHALRMSIAAQMIIQLDSEKEIASSLGFSDVPHLIRAFQHYYGCTPKEYLKTESSRSALRSAISPECSSLEAGYRSATIHPRDVLTLLDAHRKRIAKLGSKQTSQK